MSEFDELLDGVLRELAEPEPRGGLETRVLAQIGSERAAVRRTLTWRRLAFALIPMAACAGLLLMVQDYLRQVAKAPQEMALRTSFPKRSDVHGWSEMAPVTEDGPAERMGPGATARTKVRTSEDSRSGRRRREHVHAARLTNDTPKLETFPAFVQRGPLVGWFAGGPSVVGVGEAPPETVEALGELQRSQSEPIRIAAIQIPLLRGTEMSEVKGDGR
jgi:hypothetical protein